MTAKASFLSKIKGVLFKDREDGLVGEEEIHAAAKRREEETWVALALDDVLKKQPRARLQVVSLREYRTAIGEAWEIRANTIRMLSESTIRSHLRQGESCLPFGEDLFIMLLPSADEQESAKRAYDAALQLGQRLVGDKFTTGKVDGVVPQVRLASMAIAEMVDADGRVDVGAVLEVANKAVAVKKEVAKAQSAPGGAAKSAPQDQWTSVAHQKQNRPIDMMPISAAPSGQRKKSEPNWAPIVKDKG